MIEESCHFLVANRFSTAWTISPPNSRPPRTPTTAFSNPSSPEDAAPLLLPFLPKFHHALLDLTRFDPGTEEDDTRMQVILQLMKLARQKELLHFFGWLAKYPADELPESLLGKLLLYALHTDSDLDVEKIYHTLSSNPELEKNTMSVAEKLKAQGRQEGRQEGRLTSLRENVLEALDIRFGVIPMGLHEAINEQADEVRLRQLHRLAIQSPSLDAFATRL